MIRTQFRVTIKCLKTDNVRDSCNQTLTSFFQKKEIVYESSYVYTPQENRVIERKNSHLLTTTCAFLFQNH